MEERLQLKNQEQQTRLKKNVQYSLEEKQRLWRTEIVQNRDCGKQGLWSKIE
jgi:hypothetical protein